jgi:Domain of unknown function (DUF4167)
MILQWARAARSHRKVNFHHAKGVAMLNGTKKPRTNGRNNRNAGSFSASSKRSSSLSNRPRAGRAGSASAKQTYERYMTLGSAAASNGDTIESENFHQHAEHYFRLMREQGSG